jgi:hypothetical protein
MARIQALRGSSGTSSLGFFTETGSALTRALLLDSSQNATFAGKVRANSWFQGADGTNTLYSNATAGTIIQTPGSTANNNDSKIYFRNHGTTVKHTFDTNNGNATFEGDLEAAGLYVGATNTSFDLYNNGTTYLNGAVTIDHNLDITSSGVIKMAGTEVISAGRGISATTGAFTGTVTAGSYFLGDDASISLATTGAGTVFLRPNGQSTSGQMQVASNGNVTVAGALSKGSGSFKIDHPVKPDTHSLYHSFVESPLTDLIYRGKVKLIEGKASINIDEHFGMTDGTFVALVDDKQVFTTNEDTWDAVKGKVEGNKLNIECQNETFEGYVSWLVIGDRKDKHIMDIRS